MKTFKLEMVNEEGKIAIVVYATANGENEAIQNEMDKLFMRDWRAHGRIEKVIVTEC